MLLWRVRVFTVWARNKKSQARLDSTHSISPARTYVACPRCEGALKKENAMRHSVTTRNSKQQEKQIGAFLIFRIPLYLDLALTFIIV
jgi:hypothetical protein